MIKEIEIKHFMAHADLSCRDIPAINLIIGRNDTGKTGLLKLLYATAKALEIYSLNKKMADIPFRKELANKLYHTFMPRTGSLHELVQKGCKAALEASMVFSVPAFSYQQPVRFSAGEHTGTGIALITDAVEPLPDGGMNALFIPAHEVLTAFNDIRSLRESLYGCGFDDTYFDLIVSLQVGKESLASELSAVNTSLETLFEGRIEQAGRFDQSFIFKKGKQQFAMQQTAEGIKKIGILATLIDNRQLGRGTILFMDNPETALHPNAIRELVEMLVAMSKRGVQIFLASHSYFVIKQLALCARRDKLPALCWSLEKAPGQPVTHSFHDLSDGILPENSIVNEALAMYNDDLLLQSGLLSREP